MQNSKLLTGLFRTKTTIKENVETTSTNFQVDDRKTFPEYGFVQASRLDGTLAGLRVCLHKIYQDFIQEIKEDTAKQEELKRPHRLKIEERKGDIARLEKRIEKVHAEEIPKIKERIEQLKGEISYINLSCQL